MNVKFVRHAETTDNAECRLQGPETRTFTQRGERELILLASELEKFHFDVVYSSDLPRCLYTADRIAPKNSINHLVLLREKNNGNLSGQPALSIDWDALPGTFETRKLPGGESLIDVRNRAQEFWNLLSSQNANTVLVIGHGAFLKILFGLFQELSLCDSIFNLHIDHCSISEVELRSHGQTEFISMNETSHLR